MSNNVRRIIYIVGLLMLVSAIPLWGIVLALPDNVEYWQIGACIVLCGFQMLIGLILIFNIFYFGKDKQNF